MAKPHLRRGTPCAWEGGCQRTVMSKTGRVLCREHHRLTVVWKNPLVQARNQCVGFAAAPEQKREFKQLEGAEAGDHILSLCRVLGAFDFSPVKRYIPGTPEFEEVARLYA